MAEHKRFMRAEVDSYNSKDNHLVVIHNYVYDVKPFLDEHPGGHKVLIGMVGKDASEEFYDIGHSLDAKELMKKFRIGELLDVEKTPEKKRRPVFTSATDVKENGGGFLTSWRLPLILSILAILVYDYLFY